MSVNVDLFEGIRECTEEEQSLFAALLENGNVGNVLAPKVKALARKLGLNIQNVPFEKVIEDSKAAFLKQSEEERLIFMIDNLAQRVNYSGARIPEIVSLMVLQSVARNYGIDPMSLPRDMAYRIMIKFFEKMEKAYKEAWDNADPATREKIDEEINERIGQMSDSERRAIQAGLHLDQLSANTVRNVILNTSPTALLSSVVGAAGFSAYIALSVIVHSIFTTILGITLPFAVYMGLSSALSAISGPLAPILFGGGMLFTWVQSGRELNNNLLEMVLGMGLTRMFLRGDLNPIERKLLSYPSEQDQIYFDKDSKKLKELNSSVSKISKDIQKYESDKRNVQSQIPQLERNRNHSIALIEAYKSDGSSTLKLIESAKSDSLIERFEDVMELKNKLNQARIDMDTALRLAEEAERTRIQTQKELEEKQKELAKNASALQELESKLRKYEVLINQIFNKREEDMRFRYEFIYKNLSISDKTYRWLAKQTDLHVLVSAESVLHEYNNGNFILHERGKINGTPYYHNSFGPRDAYRIYYCKSNNRVCVADIGHKNIQDENIAWLRSHPAACGMMN